MRSTPLRLSLAAVTVVTLAGCGTSVSDPDDRSAGGPTVTVTNCGRELHFDTPPEAVVGLSPSQTELLLRLGLADRMVGQAQTSTAPLPDDLRQSAADVPVLSEDAPPDRETLLDAEPDFVFAPTAYEFTAEQGFADLAQLDEAGVAAYIATGGCAERRMTGTVDDLFTDLRNLGDIFGEPERAAELVDAGEAALTDVADRIEGLDAPTVAQVYVEGETLSAIGAGIEYDVIARAGGDNVFGPEDPAFADFFAAQLNPEALAEADPEVLVFSVHDADHEAATVEYLRATFPDLAAVRDDRLVGVSASDMFPGTLGNIDAVTRIAEALYPQAF
ncbi:iron complex transport system substrate-binding protein [Stackebrandtia albiflava]|uniref:Iron complex transport system substrate-binding protein n=1 Tax=Stackebrandtia albiflava TaxID=406432 RepID=A0A562UQ48_9ACTN|nr:ABC transporter substrate-binding protein [Stackebrandtia albiflava]TWJ07727.1 iron complex transport system substrate-binding protein [Stackebrandtia albiflava]